MMNIVIPMAGLGSRFPKDIYKVPKPFIKMGNTGKTMIQCAIESLNLRGRYKFIISKQMVDECDFDIHDLLYSFMKDEFSLMTLSDLTEGSADTCLRAIKDNEYWRYHKLLITNCDQIMEWNSEDFTRVLNSTRTTGVDGVVVTYPANTIKNSYVSIDDVGIATEFAEKKIISEHSLNGIHYWSRGANFITSAKAMMAKNIRVNNEFYIAPTYNEMILENKKIVIYPIKSEEHWAVGTPEDLKKYLDHAKI